MTIVESVNTAFSPGHEPDMILHFQALSDQSVAAGERFVESLLREKRE